MTRRNPERPPGPSYYRLPEASWSMIRDEYLSGWTAKEIGDKWRVSPTSVYRHASDGGWNKYARGQAFHDQIVAQAAADPSGPGETWTSLKDPLPSSMQRWPRNLPGMGPMRRPAWEPPAGYGPMPPHLVPPDPSRPPEADAEPEPEPAPSPAEAADQATAAAGRAVAEGRYEEAQKLTRLAESLRRLAPGPAAGAKPGSGGVDPLAQVEDDEAPDQGPVGDRLLNCTMNTCAVHAMYDRVKAKMGARAAELGAGLSEDICDWVDMAKAMGARIDPELAEVACLARAKGVQAAQGYALQLLGPLPPQHWPPDVEMFR